MKTLKITLVAIIVTFTAFSAICGDMTDDKPKFRQATLITLEQAIKNPGMVMAIYSQVNPDDLTWLQGKIYVGEVVYHGQLYRIKAGYGTWIHFLWNKINEPMRAVSGPKYIG